MNDIPATIVQLGNPVLRTAATPLTDVCSDITRQLIGTLQSALANTQGVGLAAPQIGIAKRLIIVASRPSKRYPYAPFMTPTAMINPSYIPLFMSDNQQEKDWEGCLSIPGIRALVPRYKDIAIHYTNIDGHTISQHLTGFVARVFQHEFDHLDGIVYLDRVVNSHDIIAESEFLKICGQTAKS